MASKSRVREITIVDEKGTFATLLGKLYGESAEYDFEGLAALRNILSNEKARLMHIIKTKSPKSIYHLAKLSGRNFKAVKDDVRLLVRFGFIELAHEKSGKRIRHKPLMSADIIRIDIKV